LQGADGAGLLAIDAHFAEDAVVGAIQIDENVAGVTVVAGSTRHGRRLWAQLAG
jgi:hypothetical protein